MSSFYLGFRPHISDSGSFDLDASGLALSVSAKLGELCKWMRINEFFLFFFSVNILQISRSFKLFSMVCCHRLRCASFASYVKAVGIKMVLAPTRSGSPERKLLSHKLFHSCLTFCLYVLFFCLGQFFLKFATFTVPFLQSDFSVKWKQGLLRIFKCIFAFSFQVQIALVTQPLPHPAALVQ